MQHPILVLASCLFVSGSALAADMSMADYLAARNDLATREYVAGLGEGLDFAIHQAGALHKSPLFCPPPRLKLTTQNFIDIVESERTADPAKSSGAWPLVGVLLRGLVKTFPCK